MKKRLRTEYVCQSCGNVSPKWLGKCSECNEWNSFVEEITDKINDVPLIQDDEKSVITSLGDIETDTSERIKTEISELNTVLGGGLVLGSISLLGGDPGIGKSTLALQILSNLKDINDPVLYISGEESGQQIKLRAERLKINYTNISFVSENCTESILKLLKKTSPKVVIIDSIQTLYSIELGSSPGSVGQIRECGSKLVRFGKLNNIAIILIGHVTKEGTIAGPKVLEHLVDTVLYFEGGKGNQYRIIRSIKNRFGSTNEIGVFEMREEGLVEVKNPSEIFLSERPTNASGSVVTACIEGTRPILIEIQALVSAGGIGLPRRTSMGIDSNRISLLVAVLDKIAGINIIGEDIFMNVAGGVTIDEPALDLGICISLVSSFLNKPLDPDIVVFGEIGLTGEIRGVSRSDIRISEAEKLGFKKCLLPNINLENNKKPKSKTLKLIGVKTVKEAIETIF